MSVISGRMRHSASLPLTLPSQTCVLNRLLWTGLPSFLCRSKPPVHSNGVTDAFAARTTRHNHIQHIFQGHLQRLHLIKWTKGIPDGNALGDCRGPPSSPQRHAASHACYSSSFCTSLSPPARPCASTKPNIKPLLLTLSLRIGEHRSTSLDSIAFNSMLQGPRARRSCAMRMGHAFSCTSAGLPKHCRSGKKIHHAVRV